MITVFTPTYNRAHLLPVLYQSLVQQTCTDFEWLIVDDGSTDGTEQLVNSWSIENKIVIRYFKQQNGGKHRAINKGVSLADGYLFFIVDSDDYLPINAIEKVLFMYTLAKQKYNCAGVAGRRMFADGSIVGSNNFTDLVSNSLEIRYTHKVTGDLVEVFETDVLKQFPFPEYKNEIFCPESLVWNRIAQVHQLYFFNEGIYTTAYIAGGLTDTIVKIRMQSPQAAMCCYAELALYKIPVLQKIKATINFWRFAFCYNQSFSEKWQQTQAIYSLISLPLGWVLHRIDLKNNK